MAKNVVVTKKALADEVANAQGMTKKAAQATVDCVFELIGNALKNGNDVDLSGFGKFTVRERAARSGINPRTKEKIKISASKAPSFKASKTLKDLVK